MLSAQELTLEVDETKEAPCLRRSGSQVEWRRRGEAWPNEGCLCGREQVRSDTSMLDIGIQEQQVPPLWVEDSVVLFSPCN